MATYRCSPSARRLLPPAFFFLFILQGNNAASQARGVGGGGGGGDGGRRGGHTCQQTVKVPSPFRLWHYYNVYFSPTTTSTETTIKSY